MQNGWMKVASLGLALWLGVGACAPIETHNTVVIEQPKPLEVNLNLSGRLELVITDARKDLETITGEKPKREVRPEDIGLPPDTKSGSTAPAAEPAAVALLVDWPLAGRMPEVRPHAVATQEQLLKSMAARNADVQKLLRAQIAGEAHTGLLVEKGKLTAEQHATLVAENADRTELYKQRAAQNHTTVEEAALAYYLQRLAYAEKGDWVESFNKTTKQWEWIHWAG